MRSRSIRIRVWGNRACFSEPWSGQERVSYMVMTPSAAKGILRAIYWKPEFEWEIVSITILRPIRMEALVRRELDTLAPVDVGREKAPITLRSTLALRHVEYVIEAAIVDNPLRKTLRDRDAHSYREEAIRRMAMGQHFRQPCLGMQGFFASWELLQKDVVVQPLPVDLSLGSMLFDQIPIDLDKDQFDPVFFDAVVEQGVLKVPEELYAANRNQVFQARNEVHHAT